MKIKINNTTIRYNNNEINRLNKIINALKKYTLLFSNRIIINLNNLEDYIKNELFEITQNSDFNNADTVFNSYLILNGNDSIKNHYIYSIGFTESDYYLILALYYYKGDIDKIYSFIIKDDENDRNKISNFIKDNNKIDIYNCMCHKTVSFLVENNFPFINDLPNFINIMKNYLKPYHKNEVINNTKITIKQLDELFISFLDYINAPDKWKKEYKYLKENNLINYNSIDNYFDVKDGTVNIDFEGFLSSFFVFVHEFVHDITYINGKPNFFLKEFPPMFFEYIVASFLLSKNYDEKEILKFLNDRFNSNLYLLFNNIDEFEYIDYFIANGNFTKDSLINMIKIKFEDKVQNGEIIDFNPETYADYFLDEEIRRYFKCDNCLMPGINYITSNLIINKMFEKVFDNDTLDRMIYITTNLPKFTYDDILKILDINIIDKPRLR